MLTGGSSSESSFHFKCRRSGRCCRVPDGFAFVDETELARLAAELGLEQAEFTKRYLRSVVDPRTAEPRLSLRDRPDGACSLLDGDNQCTAYAARPKGCRDFPVWPSIMGDPRGLERAMQLCPGIEQRPAGAARAEALADLRELFREAPAPKSCPYATPSDGMAGPYVTGLELEAILQAAPAPLTPASCPLEAPGGLCGDPGAAPLACREACSGSGSGPAPADADADLDLAFETEALAECAARRDALEASLPWPRRLGALSDLLRTRLDATAIELFPQSHP